NPFQHPSASFGQLRGMRADGSRAHAADPMRGASGDTRPCWVSVHISVRTTILAMAANVRLLLRFQQSPLSPWGFRALAEVATFPEVGGQKSGLWRGNSGILHRRRRNSERVSAR